MEESARNYRMAVEEIYKKTGEGAAKSQLADGLADQAKQVATQLDQIFNTTKYRAQFAEAVTRPELEKQYGKSAADQMILNADQLNKSQRAIDVYLTKVQAIGSAFDHVGDAVSDFVMGASVDIRALGLTIVNELGRALFIDPLLAKAKSAISGALLSGGFGSSILASDGGAVTNAAVSAASDLTKGAAKSAIDSAALAAAMSPAVVALSGSATALVGSGTALVGSATGLGASATALAGSAAALSFAASALTASATASAASSTASTLLKGAGKLIGPSIMHTGGIVGGGGLPTRSVPMSLFAGAPRYHGGGLIGQKPLKPGERPIIAQDDEEMLTRNDPRHIKNLRTFSGPALRDAETASYRGGDRYNIKVSVQAPTPSGNPQADSAAQQATAAAAAEALEAVIANASDSRQRGRSMKVR